MATDRWALAISTWPIVPLGKDAINAERDEIATLARLRFGNTTTWKRVIVGKIGATETLSTALGRDGIPVS